MLAERTDLQEFSLFTSCNRSFSRMSQMSLSTSHMEALSVDFPSLFPGLQQLELTGNNFSCPPLAFPWAPEQAYLPGNLSRTSGFQLQYTIHGLIDVPPNVFKRQLVLDHNNVQNLTNFTFHGCLYGVFLQYNDIREFGSQTFANLTCLQVLDLHGNSLTEIPRFAFDSLSRLKKLVLSHNELTQITDFHFRNLHQLTTLNLENNLISQVDPGAFSQLSSLQILNLKSNRIVHLPDGVFLGLQELHTVLLDDNPLHRFPYVPIFSLQKFKIFSLRYTQIQQFNLTEICLLELSELNLNLQDGSTISDIVKQTRTIDLTGSSIQNIEFNPFERKCSNRVKYVLCAFEFLLDSNPIHCDVSILPLSNYLREGIDHSSMRCTPIMPVQMTCATPEELRGRPLLSVRPEETYSPIQDALCPGDCRCYRRSVVNSVIVDCRGQGLRQLPLALPSGPLELWFQDNNVTSLPLRPYLPRTLTLNLSGNALQEVGAAALGALGRARHLSLAGNLLAALPPVITRLRPARLELQGNPFRCDCHALWLKAWIRSRPVGLEGADLIKCSAHDGEGQQLQLVEDEDFVCVEVDELRLGLQSGLPSGVALAALVLAVLCYLRRQELKVWVYVHTGWHPLDRDKAGPGGEESHLYDVCVLSEEELDAWSFQEVSRRLEREWGYRVFHLWRDVALGEALHESAARAAGRSRRLVVVLEAGRAQPAWLGAGLQQALSPGLQRSPHFLVLLLHGSPRPASPTLHPQLQRYIRGRRYVGARAPRMFDRLMYHMPQKPSIRLATPVEQNVRSGAPDGGDVTKGVAERGTETLISPRHNADDGTTHVFNVPIDDVNSMNSLHHDQKKTYQVNMDFPCLECAPELVEIVLSGLDENNLTCHPLQCADIISKQQVLPGEGDLFANPSFEVSLTPAITCEIVPSYQVVVQPGSLTRIDMPTVAAEVAAHAPQCIGDGCGTCRDLPVFVWYESSDFRFLMDQVVGPLSRLGVRFLLEDKDFLPGVPKSQNLLQAVAVSRCSLVVLSAASLPDEWLLFAYQVALERHLADRRHRVALLRRADCPLAALDEELKQALAATAVLEEGGPWFQHRLQSLQEGKTDCSLVPAS